MGTIGTIDGPASPWIRRYGYDVSAGRKLVSFPNRIFTKTRIFKADFYQKHCISSQIPWRALVSPKAKEKVNKN